MHRPNPRRAVGLLGLLICIGLAGCGAVQPATDPPPYGRGGRESGGFA